MPYIFQRIKGLIGISLATIVLFVSTITIAPSPAHAGDFNVDWSAVEINQRFENDHNRNNNDIDNVDILIGVIIGGTLVVAGSAYFIWDSVSYITKLIQGQVPEKTSESSNAKAASTATLVESNN
jgi:hypothetical protein